VEYHRSVKNGLRKYYKGIKMAEWSLSIVINESAKYLDEPIELNGTQHISGIYYL
jgi:hypothetical protein